MSEYDGSIKIKTQIDTKEASSQMQAMQNRIVKAADKVASLINKMDALKNTKIPTQEYKEISEQIEKAEHEYDKLLEKQQQMQNEGKAHGATWDRLNSKMEEAGNTIKYAKGELKELVDTGKAFTLGSDTGEYKALGRQLEYSENELEVLIQRYDELLEKQNRMSGGHKNTGKTLKKFASVGKSVLSSIEKGLNKISQMARKMFSTTNKSADNMNNTFKSGLKNILKYGLGMQIIYSVVNKICSAMKDGFENYYNAFSDFKNTVDSLRAGLLTLKNAIASAFAPIVQAAIPYLQQLVAWLAKAADMIAQFTAAITGQTKYRKAVQQTTAAINEQNKATSRQLSSLDKLNNLTSGSGAESGASGMFEEVPIDSYFKQMADNAKDVMSSLFEPVKKAWKKDGKFVMDSWKRALKEIKDLCKDVGSDFLEVWQQDKSVKIFDDLLKIIGDIGLVTGNLAHNFRLAWNEAGTGKKILEGIRDIIGVIIANIRHAADATVDWSKDLDFSPLLTKIQEWIDSLVPVFDTLSGIITDFYEKVLLKLGKWVLEKGLPELLQVFIDFNNKVDWKALRENLEEFWEHLEPFAEKVGEGLILFIRDVSDALADFLNSEEFKDFLHSVEDWMDKVTPQDVADGIEKIAKALLILKPALVGFKAVSSAAKGVLVTKGLLSMFGNGKQAADTAKNVKDAAGGIRGLASALKSFAESGISKIGSALKTFAESGIGSTLISITGHVLSLAAAFGVATAALEPIKKLTTDFDDNAEIRFYEKYKGFSGTINMLKDAFDDFTNKVDDFGSAMESVNEGIILTDEQMNKLRESGKLSADDVESLTEGMMDLHPELQSVREEFGLWDEYPETIEDIAQGMKLIKDGTVDAGKAFDEFNKPMWNMSDNAKKFFKDVQDGTINVSQSMDNLSGSMSDTSDEMHNLETESGKATSNMADNTKSDMQKINNSLSGVDTQLESNTFSFRSWSESVAGYIKGLWQKATKWLGDIWDKLRGVDSSTKGISIGENASSSTSKSRSVGIPDYAATALSTMDIPAYATGQVIPRTMRQHLAILGDNNKETEVVSPLSTIEQAVRNAMGDNKTDDEYIIINIDGVEIFRIMRKYAKEYYKQHGKYAFT